jgi:hypothetical protein
MYVSGIFRALARSGGPLGSRSQIGRPKIGRPKIGRSKIGRPKIRRSFRGIARRISQPATFALSRQNDDPPFLIKIATQQG